MTDLSRYRPALDEISLIKSYQLVKSTPGERKHGFDARLRLRTGAGVLELPVQEYRSHLSHGTADHIVARARRHTEPVLILALHVGAGLAAKFSATHINYLDAHGNCHIAVPPVYIHIEGKTSAPTPRADKGLRSAGYQVLFTYLAQPSLLDAPIRNVAELAGVSRQPVSDMKHRLVDDEYVFETKSATKWFPRGQREALSLWLHGYDTTVRPSLLWGTFRTQDTDPGQLEHRIQTEFANAAVSEFRWGGTAAGYRLSRHYRGERTTVHLHAAPGDIRNRLRALSDPNGNLVLMDAFGPINWHYEGDTVHPLLVYSEMLNEGSERAREAAQHLHDEYLAPRWEQNA